VECVSCGRAVGCRRPKLRRTRKTFDNIIAALEAHIAKRRAQEGEPLPDTKQPPEAA
jgi:hypothetical protein